MTLRKIRRLDTNRITTAAFELLDQEGLEAFSLRKLAALLDVHVSALYKHFQNKDALLAHLTRDMLEPQEEKIIMDDASWDAQLEASAHSLRQALVLHRDGPQLCMRYHQRIDATHATTLFTALTTHGFTPHDAAYCISTLTNYVVGFTLEEEHSKRAPVHDNAYDADTEFAYGLRLFICGIKTTIS